MGWGEVEWGLRVPAARSDGLVVTEVGDDLVVYDIERHHLHQLQRTAASIWRYCDGRRSIGEIAEAASARGVDRSTVVKILVELDRCALLAEPLPRIVQVERLSRRRLAQRIALAGALAGPAIISVTAPANAHHSAGDSCGHTCRSQQECSVGCVVCAGGICMPNQCGVPCELSDLCERVTGPCKVCTGPFGSGTCQEPPAGVGLRVRSAEAVETSSRTEHGRLPDSVQDAPETEDSDMAAPSQATSPLGTMSDVVADAPPDGMGTPVVAPAGDSADG